tara:strand:+ start:1322 stop:1723 length:402 start_codon:yes stop_codon:yes gene_type:complete
MSAGLPMFYNALKAILLNLMFKIEWMQGWRMSSGGFMGGGVYAIPESALGATADPVINGYRNIIINYMKGADIQTERGGWLCCQANYPSSISGFRPEILWFARWLPINEGGGLIVASPIEECANENGKQETQV